MFRSLKWDNKLAFMHSKSDNSSRQEIFARSSMFNIVSCIMKFAEYAESKKASESKSESAKDENRNDTSFDKDKQSENPSEAIPDSESDNKDNSTDNESINNTAPEGKSGTKHPLKINRRFATFIICDFFKYMDAYDNIDIYKEMIRRKSPVRDGRSFKRDMRAIGFTQFLYRG